MKCLCCQHDFIPNWELSNMWTSQNICNPCKMKFVKSGGCVDCGKPGIELCQDCRRWQNLGLPLHTRTMYLYNEEAKAFMHRYKFLGDTVLIRMFTDELKKVKMRRGWIVPIPLSRDRLSERKFNQAEEIARRMNGKVTLALKRDEGTPQSRKSREERLKRSNPFHVTKEVAGKNILLVDDVYTTGITLRQAMVRLKEAGASEISAVTLFRSI